MVTARGLIRRAPRLIITLIWLSNDSIPPRPEPTTTPALSASSASPTKSIPASSIACWAAPMKSWAERSRRRASRLMITDSGSHPLTSPAKDVSTPEGSNWVMGPIPETPATAAFHASPTVWPKGVRAPIPVTTTRRALSRIDCSRDESGQLSVCKTTWRALTAIDAPRCVPPPRRTLPVRLRRRAFRGTPLPAHTTQPFHRQTTRRVV